MFTLRIGGPVITHPDSDGPEEHLFKRSKESMLLKDVISFCSRCSEDRLGAGCGCEGARTRDDYILTVTDDIREFCDVRQSKCFWENFKIKKSCLSATTRRALFARAFLKLRL